MPLSAKVPIALGDIRDINAIPDKNKEHKIMILHGEGDSKLVLKYELGVTDSQVKSAKAVMKVIDPNLKTKILTKAEVEIVIQYVEDLIEAEELMSHLDNNNNERKDELVKIKQSLTKWNSDVESGAQGKVTLLKLDFIDVKDIRAELDKRMKPNGDKSGIGLFVQTLNAPNGFEQLGKVITADLVNDNSDRFGMGGGPPLKYGNKTITFKALKNPGNVFLEITKDGGSKISGLDFIAPHSKTQDLTKSLKNNHPIHLLLNNVQRSAFAANVVSDLEALVNPKRKIIISKKKLDPNAARRIVAGMVEGAKIIADALARKFSKKDNPNDWPEGVIERVTLLNKVT